jgi:hypothetical protein
MVEWRGYTSSALIIIVAHCQSIACRQANLTPRRFAMSNNDTCTITKTGKGKNLTELSAEERKRQFLLRIVEIRSRIKQREQQED